MTYLTKEYLEKLENTNSLNILTLSDNPLWKIDRDCWISMSPYNVAAILILLKQIYESWFGAEYVNSKNIIFANKKTVNDCPACFSSIGVISLFVDDGECWCQFIFQAAHELGHLMSTREKTYKIPHNFLWFMESICEAASQTALMQIQPIWKLKSPISNCEDYADSIANYYNGLISEIKKCEDKDIARYLTCKDKELKSDPYNRAVNKVFAYAIHKNFGNNTDFWHSITYIASPDFNEDMTTQEFFNEWKKAVPFEFKAVVSSVLELFGIANTEKIVEGAI